MLPKFSQTVIPRGPFIFHVSRQLSNRALLSLTSQANPQSGWPRRSYHRGNTNLPPQQSSVFRSLLGFTVIAGGAAVVIYFNPVARGYALSIAPQLEPYVAQLDESVSGLKKQWDSLPFPSIPKFPSFSQDSPQDNKQPESFNKGAVIVCPGSDSLSKHESKSACVDVAPSLPSTSEMHQKVADLPESISSAHVDLSTAIGAAERAVTVALADLRHLEMTTQRGIDEHHDHTKKSLFSSPRLSERIESAQCRATASHMAAQQQLAVLRSALDSAKTFVSEKEREAVKSAVARYGDLAYELSGLVNKVRRLQNQLAIAEDFSKANSTERVNLQAEIKAILPKPLSGKPVIKADGSQMTTEEVNSLLAMTLERIDKLCESLEVSASASKRRLATALQAHKQVSDRLIQEAVERAVEREKSKHELERLDWDKQANVNTEHELSVALARHGHHLAQMLRLKQEELEHQFDYRLREALAEQKAAIEGELAVWIAKMAAIEHVVDGRADIDRVTKETHALWLSVEALAFALEMPFSKIGASGRLERSSGELKPFATSEPLASYVDAVKEAAGTRHEFATAVADSLSRQALTDGVWTRQGLIQRFNKVYKTSCSVALVDETGGSLWNYAVSWLQSKLLFDSLGRRRIISRLPGLGPTLLTPESEVTDAQLSDTFCLLTSARAALMPEADAAVNVDPTNCADIEFAVQLLSQLKGQSAAVAADWIRDARRFLEVHQAVQALLAYATAQNMSAFEERL